MRVLFVVPYVPSLVRVRPYNLIRHLAALGHEITIATVWTDAQSKDEVEQLRRNGFRVQADYLPQQRSLWNCLRALPGSTPLQAVYSWQPALMRRLDREAANFDVVHVEHLRGANYGLALKAQLSRCGKTLPVVWDSVDCITHLFRQAVNRSQSPLRRLLTRLELGRTERYEGWLVKQFDQVLVTSTAEQAALRSLLPAGQQIDCLNVLTNGVDLAYFTPGTAAEREPARLVLSGKMSYHANVSMVAHFVSSILPLIWARQPEASLWIVGKDPPARIRGLAEDRRISVVGTVSDIRPYLQRASVAVAPLTYGAGVQNKVLEAMACATPVVAYPQAVSALAVQPGVDVLTPHGPQAFAEAVLDLLENPAQQRAIGAAGRQFVETHHRWDRVAMQLEKYYDELITAKHQ